MPDAALDAANPINSPDDFRHAHAVVRAGLPNGTRFHDLRHTYAAFVIAEGAHPQAIMERMGHSTINVTLGTYGYMFPAIDEALDEALGVRYSQSVRKIGSSPISIAGATST